MKEYKKTVSYMNYNTPYHFDIIIVSSVSLSVITIIIIVVVFIS